MNWGRQLATALFLLLIGGIVSSCSSLSPTLAPTVVSENVVANLPSVTIQSETDGEDDYQDFNIDNCGGKAEITRTETRSFTVNALVSSEIAATLGLSVDIVSAELQNSIGVALGAGTAREISIQLKAPPGTHMYFQLAWSGKSKTGTVQNYKGSVIPPVPFHSFIVEDVRVNNQRDEGCGTPTQAAAESQLETATPPDVPPSSTPVQPVNRLSTATPQIPPAVKTTPTSSGSLCDTLPSGDCVSPDSLSAVVGGNALYWTQRGPAVWGYWNQGVNATFRHPGNNMIMTYWAGFPEPRNAADCSIVIPPSDNMTRYVKCPAGTQAEFDADGAGLHLVDYTGFFHNQ